MARRSAVRSRQARSRAATGGAVLLVTCAALAVVGLGAWVVVDQGGGVPSFSNGSPSGPRPSGPVQLRVTKPDGSNVGAGVVRAVPTRVATSADGSWDDGVLTIYRDLVDRVVDGQVRVGRDGLTIENCVIRGDPDRPVERDTHLVDTGGGFTGTVVRYNDIGSSYPSPFLNGIGPRNVVAEFNDVHHVTDGFKPAPADDPDVAMTIRGNYVHDFQFYAPDPVHDPTPLETAAGVTVTGPWAGLPWNHADGIQVQVDGTTGLEVYGNTVVATWADDEVSTLPLPNAVKQLSVLALNAGDDLVIEDNWLDGGEFAVNNGDSSVTGSLARNRFGRRMATRGTGDGDYFALMISAPDLLTHDGTPDQNVWEDTGRLVPRRAG